MPVEIFVKVGDNNFPTIFKYDWHFKSTSFFKVKTDNFVDLAKYGGVVGVHSVYTEGEKTMLNNTLNVTTSGYGQTNFEFLASQNLPAYEVTTEVSEIVAISVLIIVIAAFSIKIVLKKPKKVIVVDRQESASNLI